MCCGDLPKILFVKNTIFIFHLKVNDNEKMCCSKSYLAILLLSDFLTRRITLMPALTRKC